MDTINQQTYAVQQPLTTHSQLLQWLLNPQSSSFSRIQIQEIDWHHLLNYYLNADNEERYDVLVDYLCRNDYQQLCNHALLPLIYHRLLPMILSVCHSSTSTSSTINDIANKRLLTLSQLLARQPFLMKTHFHNSPKALVNIFNLLRQWEQTSMTPTVFNTVRVLLFDLTLSVYLQLPRKPAYRFAMLELRTLLLRSFREIYALVLTDAQLAERQLPCLHYFKTIQQRQQLFELIENRQLRENLQQENDGNERERGIPGLRAEEPCISREINGLMRSWF